MQGNCEHGYVLRLWLGGTCMLTNSPIQEQQPIRQSAPSFHSSISHPRRTENKAPSNASGRGDLGVLYSKMVGPLYKVRIVAPMTQTKIPSTLACPSLLRAMIFSFLTSNTKTCRFLVVRKKSPSTNCTFTPYFPPMDFFYQP
jgi:hypothetical protein